MAYWLFLHTCLIIFLLISNYNKGKSMNILRAKLLEMLEAHKHYMSRLNSIDKDIRELKGIKIYPIAGVHLNNKNYVIKQCNENDKVHLVAQPENEFDENAIGVFHDNKQIGFIPATDTDEIHKLLPDSYYAYIHSKDYHDGYLDVKIEVTRLD